MVEISSIKPEPSQGMQRPKAKITWNDGTEKSLKEQGFWPETGKEKDGIYYQEPPQLYTEQKRFESEADISKGPIERRVTRIVRQKAIDWSSEKKERKEYLVWYENWTAKNWLGVKIAPVCDHIEGTFTRTTKEVRLDPKTGAALDFVKGKPQQAFYIPFSKKNVDKIIEGWHNDPKDSVKYVNDRDSIRYVVKFGSDDAIPGQGRYGTRDYFSYDQFVNWTFDQLYKYHTTPLDKRTDPNYAPTMTSYK